MIHYIIITNEVFNVPLVISCTGVIPIHTTTCNKNIKQSTYDHKPILNTR